MNLWIVFLTGLTSGGVTCAAMQGGILASIIANGKKEQRIDDKSRKTIDSGDWGPVAAFLSTKLIAHIILGLFLGWLGSRVQLSINVRMFFQTVAALFMFGTAMNLLDVHPVFRFLAIQPPKFAYKLLKGTEKAKSLFAPAMFGFLTILIPCGVTQAMEVLAISSGDPVKGALIMGSFILGTAPVFGLIGLATAKLTEQFRLYFLRAASVLLIAMSVISINGVLQVADSPLSIQRIGPKLVKLLPPYEKTTNSMKVDPNVKLENGVQKVTIEIQNGGYVPKRFQVKAGVPVELTLNTKGGVYSCATAFTFKAFNINDMLKPVDTKVHKFTPTEKGQFTFACSMGMYSGIMEVI